MAAAEQPVATSGSRPGEGSERDPEALFRELQALDPDVLREDYCRGECDWDVEGLAEDLHLTSRYGFKRLEQALEPLRAEMQSLAARRAELQRGRGPVARSRSPPRLVRSGEDPTAKDNVVLEIVPGKVLLGDRHAAANLEALKSWGVRRVLNCSPQTVRTGSDFYQDCLPGTGYMELWPDDLADVCVLQDFDAAWTFVNQSGVCLMHCEAGVNRSCALALALCMRFGSRANSPSPDELLRISWRFVGKHRQRALTNLGFQRQLLLYARLGHRWPALGHRCSVWRTPAERRMAKFRALAERICEEAVSSWPELPIASRKRTVVYLRDGVMRQESDPRRSNCSFDLSSKEAVLRAERKLRSYASVSKARILQREGLA